METSRNRPPAGPVLWLALILGSVGTARGQGEPTVDGKSLAQWVDALRRVDHKPWLALRAIGRFGPKAAAAVPSLIAALDDGSERVQSLAIAALEQIGPDAAAAAPALVGKLGDERFVSAFGIPGPPPTHRAVEALVAIGPAAVPGLIGALGGDSQEIRIWATRALGELGPAARPAVPALARLLKERGFDDGESAAKALGAIGPSASEAIPTIHSVLDALGPDDGHAGVLLEALDKIGAPPSAGMIQELDDPDPAIRETAAFSLGEFGATARPAVPRLEAALRDPVRSVRVEAACALVRIDPANDRALPVLIESLDDTDTDVLLTALGALEELGPKAVAAAPKLKTIIERPDLRHKDFVGDQLRLTIESARASAAAALAIVSPDPSPGVPALLKLMDRGDNEADWYAIDALGSLGPKASAAAPALAALTRDRRSRYEAVHALVQIDPKHEAICPALIDLLLADRPEYGDFNDNTWVIATLGEMGPQAASAVPALARVLEASDRSSVQSEAMKALGRIGPSAPKEALAALVRAFKDKRASRLRTPPSLALCSMGAAAAPAVPDLLALLKAGDSRSEEACWVLGAIGPAAKAAVPALVALLNGEKASLAAPAGCALVMIDPSARAIVEARVGAISEPYAQAILSGALGRETPEGDWFTNRILRAAARQRAALKEAERPRHETARREAIGKLESHLEELARLGAGASVAIPFLVELARHDDPWLRSRAAAATLRIKSGPGFGGDRR